MNQTIFVLDTYSEFAPLAIQDLVRYKFLLNDHWYAIYEVGLEWGKPDFPMRPIDEEQLPFFEYFETFEDAYKFVKELKRLNG